MLTLNSPSPCQCPWTAFFRTSAHWSEGWKWPKRSFWFKMTAPCWRSSSRPTVNSLSLWSKTARQHRSACTFSQTYPWSITVHLWHVSTHSRLVQEAYGSVVEYFGENPKTTQPSMFFPLFGRFIKAFKVRKNERDVCVCRPVWFGKLNVPCFFFFMQTAQQEIEQRKKLERESKEENQSPSPNKATSPKVLKIRRV